MKISNIAVSWVMSKGHYGKLKEQVSNCQNKGSIGHTFSLKI